MKRKTFRGGVHPPERKERTDGLPVEAAFPPSRTVCIPVTQGGAPNAPVVREGDPVRRGQVIASSDSPVSVPVHASVSGTVKKIEKRLVTGNTEALCVVIEAAAEEDGAEGKTADMFLPPLDPFACTPDEALARIRDAGIVGMGGAAFPAHVKFRPPADMPVQTVIANGAECEPYLTADACVLETGAAAVLDGLAIVMRITGAKSGILALEDNKRRLLPGLEAALAAYSARPEALPVSLAVCRTKYPQGAEKMLISALTGREVPSGSIPAAAGCIVANVSTLKAVSEAFRAGKPLIERVVTLSGGACREPRNLLVPVGTLVSDLIEGYSALDSGVAEIVAGGPMMGVAVKSPAFPVAKNTSGVLFLTKKEAALSEEGPCIGCGRCMKVCACRLNPVLIVRALKTGNLEAAKRFGLMDCVECGTCAYVCPASVKLVQRFKTGKFQVREEAARVKERAQHTG